MTQTPELESLRHRIHVPFEEAELIGLIDSAPVMIGSENLERYADYSNRTERGRSYIGHGSVLDLRIKPGEVKALVAGTQSQPYKVVIKIKSIKKSNWQKIKKRSSGRLESMQDLLSGKFPEELADVFYG